MLEVKIFTLYPDFYPGLLNKGIYRKAQEKKIMEFKNYKYKRLCH